MFEWNILGWQILKNLLQYQANMSQKYRSIFVNGNGGNIDEIFFYFKRFLYIWVGFKARNNINTIFKWTLFSKTLSLLRCIKDLYCQKLIQWKMSVPKNHPVVLPTISKKTFTLFLSLLLQGVDSTPSIFLKKDSDPGKK